jgi:pyruvate dehydrogenase E2 component (dihydrolipoamide acetyltransferase)
MTLTKVVLAKLSPTMEEGTIVKWNKKEGDAVKVGDVLAEIETDKANMEMEALGNGVLRKVLVPAGGKAPVGALIGVIAEPNEDIGPLLAKAGAPAAPAAAPPAAAPAAAAPAAKAAEAAPAPATTNAAQAPAAPPTPAPPPEPAPPQAPAKAAAQPGEPAPRPAPAPAPAPAAHDNGEAARVKASPLARSMAAQQNIPLASIAGSGPGGRIIKRDVEAWSPAAARGPAPGRGPAPAKAPGPAPAAAAPAVTPGQEIPLSGMRKTIARRLSESKVTAPHFYVTVEIAMDGAVALREQLLRAEEIKVSFNDLVVKACAKALARFPMVNASWAEDRIATHAEVHVGVAVAIADGLIVPVVRNADRKSILEIAREVKDLAGRARERKLKPEEFTGSTFSISNLGMYDVTEFTAIINPPESAILAVGAVQQVPVAVDGALAVGHRMRVTMSSDHRVVDGALAAQFLAEVRRLLENPVTLLL